MFEDIRYDVQEGIARITLNRPEKLNALRRPMVDEWADALEAAQADETVRVIIVTGAGRAFCAGGDLDAIGSEARSGLEDKRFLFEHVHRIPLTLAAVDKPVIAMVNGAAMGAGMDMALQCDLRIAADAARFGESYIKVGVPPGDGGAYFLPRMVGMARALQLLWFGDVIDAREAERIGIVNWVVPAAELESSTLALARRLVNGPSVAIRMIKRAVYQSSGLDLRTALDLISSHMAIALTTEDHREGLRAFQEKRVPRFCGL
jgi:2-(1,2-epoxy-1,2-dihydrophenyl)acetyl-CoA isomerase